MSSPVEPHSIRVFVTGFLMGTADLVPGISGGTVALLSGIYARLLAAISAIDIGIIGLLLSEHFLIKTLDVLSDGVVLRCRARTTEPSRAAVRRAACMGTAASRIHGGTHIIISVSRCRSFPQSGRSGIRSTLRVIEVNDATSGLGG